MQLRATDEDGKTAAFERLRPALDAPGVRTEIGGNVPFLVTANEQTTEDITRAETLSLPVLLVLLILIFGGLVAAATPLLIGGLAILGAFVAVRLLHLVTDVSVFAVNIITLIGLGMAIDYALFVVSRFREELAAGHDTPTAIARVMATAGRTVLVSGLTIALALASLLIFPQVFLRSMGLGGVAAVLVAMLAALTVLPALLAVLGPRINALRVPLPGPPRRRRARSAGASGGGTGRLGAARPQRDAPAGALPGRRAGGPRRAGRSVPADRVRRHRRAGAAGRLAAADRGRADRAEFPGGNANPIDVLVSGVPAESAQRFAEQVGRVPG